jgi:hypothetical protein
VGKEYAARPAADRHSSDDDGMRRAAVVLAVVAALAGAGNALAQEPTPGPPPVPVSWRLVETAPGAYRLEMRAEGPIAPYRVRVFVTRIGTDQGVVSDVATGTERDFAIDLQLPLDGMSAREPACYRVGFDLLVRTQTKPGSFEEDPVASTGGFACVDAAGAVTFPGHDSVVSPPPAPPSDVRLAPEGDGQWRIEWRDNSGDEIAFDPGILLFDKPWTPDVADAASYGGIEMPMVPADWTDAHGINFFFVPDGPAEPTCGYALVLVFAVGADAVSLPGNTTVPACFSRGRIDFPATGEGAVSDHGVRLPLAVLLAAVGSIIVALGAAVARPRSY